MPLIIEHPEAQRLAEALATLTGETPSDAVLEALREKMLRTERLSDADRLRDRLLQIGRDLGQHPELDPRTADEIIGYDEYGVPR